MHSVPIRAKASRSEWKALLPVGTPLSQFASAWLPIPPVMVIKEEEEATPERHPTQLLLLPHQGAPLMTT